MTTLGNAQQAVNRAVGKARWTAQSWQTDPDSLETEKVQFWKGGTMMTAQMTKEHAQELVRSGRAFVISSQAIGQLDENGQPVE